MHNYDNATLVFKVTWKLLVLLRKDKERKVTCSVRLEKTMSQQLHDMRVDTVNNLSTSSALPVTEDIICNSQINR